MVSRRRYVFCELVGFAPIAGRGALQPRMLCFHFFRVFVPRRLEASRWPKGKRFPFPSRPANRRSISDRHTDAALGGAPQHWGVRPRAGRGTESLIRAFSLGCHLAWPNEGKPKAETKQKRTARARQGAMAAAMAEDAQEVKAQRFKPFSGFGETHMAGNGGNACHQQVMRQVNLASQDACPCTEPAASPRCASVFWLVLGFEKKVC